MTPARIGTIEKVAAGALALGVALVVLSYALFEHAAVNVNIATEGVGIILGGFLVAILLHGLIRRDRRKTWALCQGYLEDEYRNGLVDLYRAVAETLWHYSVEPIREVVDLSWVAEQPLQYDPDDFMDLLADPGYGLDPEYLLGPLVDRFTVPLVTLSEEAIFVHGALELAGALQRWRRDGREFWDSHRRHVLRPEAEEYGVFIGESGQLEDRLVPGTGTFLGEKRFEAREPTADLFRAAHRLHDLLPKAKQFEVAVSEPFG